MSWIWGVSRFLERHDQRVDGEISLAVKSWITLGPTIFQQIVELQWLVADRYEVESYAGDESLNIFGETLSSPTVGDWRMSVKTSGERKV